MHDHQNPNSLKKPFIHTKSDGRHRPRSRTSTFRPTYRPGKGVLA